MFLDWLSTAQVIERAVVETNHVGVHKNSIKIYSVLMIVVSNKVYEDLSLVDSFTINI